MAGTIIDIVYNSYYKDLGKVLMAFSGASASYSQNKPGSQCEVAVTCQSLAKCRYRYEYVVVGGQYYATGMGTAVEQVTLPVTTH